MGIQTRIAGAAVAVCAVLLIGCAATEKSMQEQGVKPMTEAELRALHARDWSFRWQNARGMSGTGQSRVDGSLSAQAPGGSATGRYRFAGGQYCAKWGDAAEYCLRFYRTGPREYKTFRADDGQWVSTLQVTD